MKPRAKEYLILAVWTVMTILLGVSVLLSVSGCAHQEPSAAPSHSLTAAQNEASLIDLKTVVIERWLKSNP